MLKLITPIGLNLITVSVLGVLNLGRLHRDELALPLYREGFGLLPPVAADGLGVLPFNSRHDRGVREHELVEQLLGVGQLPL